MARVAGLCVLPRLADDIYTMDVLNEHTTAFLPNSVLRGLGYLDGVAEEAIKASVGMNTAHQEGCSPTILSGGAFHPVSEIGAPLCLQRFANDFNHPRPVLRVDCFTCAWRINRIKRLSEFGTSLDSASSTGTNRYRLVIPFLPLAVPAGALPALHAFDGHYSNVENHSNVENRLASPPDRLWSRIRCDRDTRGESCR